MCLQRYLCLHVVIIALSIITGDPASPTNLHQISNITGPKYCSHEIGWSISDTRGLKEYTLISITNRNESSVMEWHISPEENKVNYSKKCNDDVNLAIRAISQCNVSSDMSDYLNLRKLLVYIVFTLY